MDGAQILGVIILCLFNVATRFKITRMSFALCSTQWKDGWEWLIQKRVIRSVCGLFKVLSHNLRSGDEKNREKHMSKADWRADFRMKGVLLHGVRQWNAHAHLSIQYS
jgi:hypothetical protein